MMVGAECKLRRIVRIVLLEKTRNQMMVRVYGQAVLRKHTKKASHANETPYGE